MWKEKYKELMFSNDASKIDTVEGGKLKLEKLPVLYKYSGIDKYSLANLSNDTAWFRNAAGFNDPYDSALSIGNRAFYEFQHKDVLVNELSKIFQTNTEEISKIISEFPIEEGVEKLLEEHSPIGQSVDEFKGKFKKFIKETDELLERHSTNISGSYQECVYASCFSEDPLSMLMWSHYADNHKGMVLEYDFLNLDSSFHEETLWALHPVLYTKELVNLNNYLEHQDKIDVPILAAISKLDKWVYEKEWRMLFLSKSEEQGKIIKLIKPKSVILGARIEQMHKIMISLDAKKKGIPVKQIKLDSTKYQLSIVDFNEFD
ncbi:DUF2971 domain-containing protein [Sporosarcina highlanderae]|uniref:DUF2971 domain-containing protein n=1 Tax=Sporosarcina highlanderae TaxID=3035916 RepID=A0ABT8JUQ0_9BACL|nr:DUF2971 domain-containing protein [Sporosarcina highlanderae]MDN4607904.1 DUF2971 domain-containing protein [Sporosarcina highlanderae]